MSLPAVFWKTGAGAFSAGTVTDNPRDAKNLLSITALRCILFVDYGD